MAKPDKQPTPSCHVVAVPYPGRGHINPMLNLCNAVAQRSADIFITIVVTEEWLGLIGSMKKPVNVSFEAIPNVVPSESVRGDDLIGFVTAVLTNMEEPFERLLDERRLQPPVLIIADAFLPWAGEVASRRNIPVAYLWCMSASMYAVFYHFDLLVQNGHFPVDLSVNGEAIVDYIPGLPPVRLHDLPHIMRNQEHASMFLKSMPNYPKAKYLIFTSIFALESQVINALMQNSPFSIYNIGPATSLFKLKNTTNNDTNNTYSTWLDSQPRSSVLYISLGSFINISTSQIDEIAAGLRRSGVCFLWVARQDTSRLQEICGEKGLVVEWCDQLRVLSHVSVGGFLSHCGWNSTKEGVLAGVPVLAFPIFMDQLHNAKMTVEEWRVGWRIVREFDEEKVVKGDEIGEIVKRFMDLGSVERGEISENVKELRKISEREFESGGSYESKLDGFVGSIMSHCTLKA